MAQVLGFAAVVVLLAVVQWRRRGSRLRRGDNAPPRQERPPGDRTDGR